MKTSKKIIIVWLLLIVFVIPAFAQDIHKAAEAGDFEFALKDYILKAGKKYKQTRYVLPENRGDRYRYVDGLIK